MSSRIQAILMLAISIGICGAFLLGVASRPSIFYHVSTPLNYNSTIDFPKENLKVSLDTRNRGYLAAEVRLVVSYYNLTLEKPEDLEISKIGDASIVRVSLISAPGREDYESFEVEFSPNVKADYAVIIFFIEADSGADLQYRFGNSLAVFNPERPTAILLKNLGDGTFMRVRSR